MADADPECLMGGPEGNVGRLRKALRESGLELLSKMDGEVLEGTKENYVLRVACTLERALNALPPPEVAQAVIDRLKSLKHAPRTNNAACVALTTTLIGAARSFAAQDDASAEKTTVNLGGFPIIDDETLALRTAQNLEWTAAPAAGRAAVWSGVPFDSYALRTAAPLQEWPEWRGRPTIVADPVTEIDGEELGKIKEMGVLAKKLVKGEESNAKKREPVEMEAESTTTTMEVVAGPAPTVTDYTARADNLLAFLASKGLTTDHGLAVAALESSGGDGPGAIAFLQQNSNYLRPASRT